MKGRAISYTDQELAFIRRNRKLPRAESHALFCHAFGRDDVSLSNYNALCKRNGWMTGRTGCYVKGQTPVNKGKKCPPGKGGNHPNAQRTQFKKGREPHNTQYLGHERLSKDGYVEISVAQTNPHTGYARRYVLKHRWLWEEVNGPVPDDYALKCLDGNKSNTDPENWEAIPRAVLSRLNGGRFRKRLAYNDAPPELKPTVMAAAKLKHAVQTARKART